MLRRCPSSVSCPWLPWLSSGLAPRSLSISSVQAPPLRTKLPNIDVSRRYSSIRLSRHRRSRQMDLVCTCPPQVFEHLVQADLSKVLANLLALAAICPFVGSLSDLMGRRYVAIIGSCFVILGMIISSTATNMNNFIGKSFSSLYIQSTPDGCSSWHDFCGYWGRRQ